MRVLPRPVLLLLGLLAAAVSGCATRPPASDPDAVADFEQTNDPLEPTNRVFFAINNGLDTVILKPAAQAYAYVVPDPVRNGIHNFLSNLGTPVQLGNDMLEGKPRRAGDTTMRFLINTTVGVFGIFDVAKGWGYPDHDADFGMTLASWGVPEGPFLFLPVLGPSDPRDAVGFGERVLPLLGANVRLGREGEPGHRGALVAFRVECGGPAVPGARGHRFDQKDGA